MCFNFKKKPIRCEIVVTTSSSIMQHFSLFVMFVWSCAFLFGCVGISWSTLFVYFHNIAGYDLLMFLQLQCMLKHLAECNEIKIMFFPHCRCSSVFYYFRLHKDPKSCLPFFWYDWSFSHNYLLLNCSFIQTILQRGKCCLMMFFAG